MSRYTLCIDLDSISKIQIYPSVTFSCWGKWILWSHTKAIPLKAAMHVWLPWPTSLIPFANFRNANDLNKGSLAQMMKDVLFFTYRLLQVNSVTGIKSTI